MFELLGMCVESRFCIINIIIYASMRVISGEIRASVLFVVQILLYAIKVGLYSSLYLYNTPGFSVQGLAEPYFCYSVFYIYRWFELFYTRPGLLPGYMVVMSALFVESSLNI